MSALRETFDAYKAAESAAMQAFIAYKFGEVSEAEVHRLQRLSSLAHAAHIEAMSDRPADFAEVEGGAVMAELAAHEERTQNMDGDWLCACGAFLCPPKDARLNLAHREHVATVLIRALRLFSPAEADRG